MGRAWRPSLKKEEDAAEEERRVRSILKFSAGRVYIKVAAMVERVVKRQADLGVDIVTDGEVELHLAAVFQKCKFHLFPQVGREGYYMHFLRHGVQGIDVTHLSDKVIAF